ncbi:phytase [Goodfellowiella coeruleoviolacea]|uniref:Phytase n=1 Tax=Goodfellowiella coeruleoviolacea TaxID=334858 RepID=A0AAE3KFJ5_9PSEU|nr:phytase [Goodfellowiella coeruleoviolacea]MCP2166431.1 Phytase [Goodfellowiella coeruleoviolacea]
MVGGADPGFGGRHLSADVEGLTLCRGGADDEGYLIVSSQGDSTYAVDERADDSDYLGSFRVGPGAGGLDATLTTPTACSSPTSRLAGPTGGCSWCRTSRRPSTRPWTSTPTGFDPRHDHDRVGCPVGGDPGLSVRGGSMAG